MMMSAMKPECRETRSSHLEIQQPDPDPPGQKREKFILEIQPAQEQRPPNGLPYRQCPHISVQSGSKSVSLSLSS